jgi:hypothetical protein
MMMSNGSILVVGGESGSNGPPVPSLEILPNPVGGAPITLDYLQRTDPNNLYPFLLVLPSGRIFIGEATRFRIRTSTYAACFQDTTMKLAYWIR